ncbi:unnamed protein product [Acanthoscelides obtectus]|uniref:Uncharacterized protein n=1 Tax=Acanthoscelides obtectus TaxID=200917 RepID=A0A9P0P9U9_ACAOB|nr:unnamed protein product [Acanthoscelides obtectus]CAK1666747.1 hypothetical protein AOBTE_LOCUS25466 [Acanthoscelides obtectus]
MSLLKTIETISKLPSVKFCIPVTNQHQHIRITQNNAAKPVFRRNKCQDEGPSPILQLAKRAQLETQVRPYHVMTGGQILDMPSNSQGYILPVRSTPVSQFKGKHKGGKGQYGGTGGSDGCPPCKTDPNPCKMQNCKLKKPKRKNEHECDPDEPEDICKRDSPCNWYPGKKPCK